MNDESVTCEICGEEALPREWLRCMLCGKRFHFYPEGAPHDDCGVIAPNPASNGC